MDNEQALQMLVKFIAKLIKLSRVTKKKRNDCCCLSLGNSLKEVVDDFFSTKEFSNTNSCVGSLLHMRLYDNVEFTYNQNAKRM